MSKKIIYLHKLTSCSGCLVEFLNVLSKHTDILEKAIVVSKIISDDLHFDRFDAVFIEGSLSTRDEESRLIELRNRAKYLIVLGSCGLYGGIQNLGLVHNKPVARVVNVDYALPGCPVNEEELSSLLYKVIEDCLEIRMFDSLCMDCKRNGIECLLIRKGIACLGPLVRAGCGALCPSSGKGCLGCFGFRNDLDKDVVENYVQHLSALGFARDRFNTYYRSYSLVNRNGE